MVKETVLKYFSQTYEGGFGPPPLSELSKIPDSLIRVYISWRNLTIIGKLKTLRIPNLRKLVNTYRPGQLRKLSNKHKVPPLWLLKKVAKFRKDLPTPNQLSVHANITSKLLARDIVYALDNDLSSSKWLEKETVDSKKFEEKIGDWLASKQIGYREENEIKEGQKREYGRVIATPDFLLDEAIIINGQSIHWIDAKNYILFESFLTDHIRAQAARYNKMFGNGAMIFSQGVVDNVTISSTLVLDARQIL